MRMTGRVACVGEMTNAYRIYFENLKSKEPLGNLDVVWRITLKWILNKKMCLNVNRIKICGTEAAVSIKTADSWYVYTV